MTYSDSEWIIASKRRELVLLDVLDMPRTAAEARILLAYSDGNKLDATFRELHTRSIVRPISDGLWGLTEKGREVRRQLLRERGRLDDYHEPRLEWRTYVWVLRGSRRKNVLAVLEERPQVMSRLLRVARRSRFAAKMTREKAYAAMEELVSKQLAAVEKQAAPNGYRLTNKGLKVKTQVIAAADKRYLRSGASDVSNGSQDGAEYQGR